MIAAGIFGMAALLFVVDPLESRTWVVALLIGLLMIGVGVLTAGVSYGAGAA